MRAIVCHSKSKTTFLQRTVKNTLNVENSGIASYYNNSHFNAFDCDFSQGTSESIYIIEKSS
jgi:hypothetical protein